MMRGSNAGLWIVIFFAGYSFADAAETVVPEAPELCRDVMRTSDTSQNAVTFAWVAGFLSGLNQTSNIDLLKGQNVSKIVGRLQTACLEMPDRTTKEAALAIIAQLRAEAEQWRRLLKQKKER